WQLGMRPRLTRPSTPTWSSVPPWEAVQGATDTPQSSLGMFTASQLGCPDKSSTPANCRRGRGRRSLTTGQCRDLVHPGVALAPERRPPPPPATSSGTPLPCPRTQNKYRCTLVPPLGRGGSPYSPRGGH